MRKVFGVVLAVVIGSVISGVLLSEKAYAAKEALWEENFDAMEEGEQTGLAPLIDKQVDIEVQNKVVNGKKGKAVRISPVEGADYSTNYNCFGVRKDIVFPNENAIISFYYYLDGVAGLNLMSWDRTIEENCDGSIAGLVQRKWTKVVLRFGKFKVKSPKGAIKDGDEFSKVYFMSQIDPAKPIKEQSFYIDDIKLTIGKDDESGETKKEEAKPEKKKK